MSYDTLPDNMRTILGHPRNLKTSDPCFGIRALSCCQSSARSLALRDSTVQSSGQDGMNVEEPRMILTNSHHLSSTKVVIACKCQKPSKADNSQAPALLWQTVKVLFP